MSNNLTLSDAINAALDTGKEATFSYGGTLYTFSPQGLIDFITAEGGGGVTDPLEIDDLVVNNQIDATTANVFTDDLSVAGTLEVTGANVYMTALPTVDPAEAGLLWNDGGTLKVSAG